MASDPIVAWMIAIVICTIYGVVMYKRGYNRGNSDATSVICAALSKAGAMKPEQILKHVERYAETLLDDKE